MKICSKCRVLKSKCEFSKNKRTKDGFSHWCKTCMRDSQSIIQRNLRDKIDLKKRPCEKCGESRVYLIEFHHINPLEKQFDIGKAASQHRNELSILAEIDKCVCLCSNCHKEYHYLYGSNPIKPVESLNEYLEVSNAS